MKEKLSQTEIEERKKQNILETAKMNSCISGIPLSDLIQSGIQRGNYGDKDCMVKQQFLKNLVEPVTSRELYETLKRQNYTGNYNTFRGLLFRYQKYGYVKKSNDKKPFMYQLTDKGYQHAKNPYLSRELMARNYLEHLYRNIEKELVDHPEALKALLESITQMNIGSPIGSGVTVASNSGSQYNDNFGNEELKQELNSKIFNNEFFKNADELKLKTLIDGILDPCLTQEEKQELMLDAFQEAVKSNKTMIFKQQEYQSNKPIGERRYYEVMVKAVNQLISRSTYEAIPFRFIRVGNDIRLKSIAESGTYRNNQDGTILDFDYVNRNWFQNQMKIKTEPGNKELTFFYIGGNSRIKITTMSFNDYEKAKGKANGIKLKINT
ncbi:hypothetical protein MSMAT_1951 [Methanosarcina mazei TMA]|jgi:hypothetical protein|uniref:hypothetical protein n=1 Tax=Methanosarcina mazei TaxID=2209 RepID=UPI001C328258|nr:hypothetical protein [Methanosarcina mazei]UWJ23208.1 hypothetical protein MSMAT_1951 [Methanosarcina mazei TMA]BBL63979.1 hypothetical protein MmazTMA_09560 [Methanosarcina mazei]